MVAIELYAETIASVKQAIEHVGAVMRQIMHAIRYVNNAKRNYKLKRAFLIVNRDL
jgi:GTP1/Obg family GTP-binding protein